MHKSVENDSHSTWRDIWDSKLNKKFLKRFIITTSQCSWWSTCQCNWGCACGYIKGAPKDALSNLRKEHKNVHLLVPKSAQKNSCNSGPEAALEDKFHARLIVALEVEP